MAELLRDRRGEMRQKRVSVVCDILIVFCSISELGTLPVEAIRAISSNIHKVLILIYYIDTSVLLENIPFVKFIKTTSGT